MKQFDFRGLSLYQIWIRSFADGNGDGIGDLYGVYDKLEYIRDLGVGGIWFSPVYPSPNADYGYDISDYRNIHPDYGTLEQFKKVLDKAHALGMKVIMDLVINHTSDEHPWFLESRKSKDNPYSDYYIWRDARPGHRLPNNWDSQFEGKAWEYCPERDQYYLHVFAKKQPDLNMDNPAVREEVKSIMRYWLDMGVDGFREDVITYISKHEQLPDGLPFVPVVNGLPFYKDGPNIMKYLREFREVAKEYGAIQVGEAPLTPIKTALTYLSGEDRVLDMMIQFDTMGADCIINEYMHLPFSLRKYKRAVSLWQNELAGKAWNTLYLENHDHPRIINRYGSLQFWKESGKALAASYLFLQGCPFVYQGQEIGMTNIELDSIDQYIDVASKNMYRTFFTHMPQSFRMHLIHLSSRDSSRTPMQWSDAPNAGFTTGKPWFVVNPNYPKINVAAEKDDPDSILHFYRKALRLRSATPALLYGTYTEYQRRSRRRFVYAREYEGERVLVVISFAKQTHRHRLPQGFEPQTLELLLSNYPDSVPGTLRPYEAQVWRAQEMKK